MLISLIVIAVIAALYYQDYASVGRNNSYLKKIIIPTQYVYSSASYVKENYLTTPEPYREIGVDAKQSEGAQVQAAEKPTLLVFVVGETARSQKLSAKRLQPRNQSVHKQIGRHFIPRRCLLWHCYGRFCALHVFPTYPQQL